MSVYILIKAVDGWDNGENLVWETGFPVDCRDKNRIGGKQVPPRFIQVELTDENDWQDAERTYCKYWEREIDWEFVGHDYSTDGHRLKVFTKPELVSVSGLNGLTRDKVEIFLNNWGAVVQSIGQNEVVFDAVILDAIESNGFWGGDVSLITWNEKDYDQGTGVHRVEANYSASAMAGSSNERVEGIITDRGGAVTKHVANKVTFEISRTAVFSVFKADVKKKTEAPFSQRAFKILSQHVQMAIDNGGTLSVTRQQFAQYVYNRLND